MVAGDLEHHGSSLPKTAFFYSYDWGVRWQEQSQTNPQKCWQLASIGSFASLAGSSREHYGPSAVEASVRLYNLVPHHLPVVYDRLVRIDHCSRGAALPHPTTLNRSGFR